MKQKLWVAYGVFGLLTLIAMLTNNVIAAYTLAFIGAAFGWAAFFLYS